jgi:DNA-binding transcriptional ArsR family regulator
VEAFAALADETRRQIIELLAREELSAGEVASHFACTQPAISHHLRVLREAGLVQRQVDAQRRLYTLNPNGLDTLDDWLSAQRQFWSQRLDRLDQRIHRDLESGTTPGAERSENIDA